MKKLFSVLILLFVICFSAIADDRFDASASGVSYPDANTAVVALTITNNDSYYTITQIYALADFENPDSPDFSQSDVNKVSIAPGETKTVYLRFTKLNKSVYDFMTGIYAVYNNGTKFTNHNNCYVSSSPSYQKLRAQMRRLGY